MPSSGWITEKVLARALDLSVDAIRQLTRDRIIPSVQLPTGEYRYRLDAVIQALTGQLPFYRGRPGQPSDRLETLEGKVTAVSAPTLSHQRVSARLTRLLQDYFRAVDPLGEVLTAPLEVTLQDFTVVQPDIIYIAGRQQTIIQGERIVGAPNLIVEISTEASRCIDRDKKYNIYLQAGVQHYWIVDPEEKTVRCYALHEDKYILIAKGREGDVVNHPSFAGLSLHLARLWQKETRR